MTRVADRYVRTGADVPSIYPGTLTGLTAALRDVQRLSARFPGRHHLDALFGPERVPFRVYEGGECVWQAVPE